MSKCPKNQDSIGNFDTTVGYPISDAIFLPTMGIKSVRNGDSDTSQLKFCKIKN